MERKYKVMVAEDEPLVLAGLKLFAEEWGKAAEQITEASNGNEAFDKCFAVLPDIIISDIRMPGMSGLELLGEIRKAGMRTKLIFCSGYAEFEYAREAVRLGAFDYLLKPIQREKLWKVLDEAAAEIARAEEWKLSVEEKTEKMEAVCEAIWVGNSISFEQLEKNTGMEFPGEKFQIFVVGAAEGETLTDADELYGAVGDVRYLRISLGKNKLALILNLPKETDRKAAQDTAEAVLQTKLKGGSSGCAEKKDRVSVLMEEAEAAFATSELIGGNRILAYQTAEAQADFLKRRMLEGILENDTKKTSDALEQLWRALQKEEMMLAQVIGLYNELLILLCGKDRYYERYEKADASCIRELLQTKTDIYELFMNLYKERTSEPKSTEMIVRQVIKDIEENYREEITLSSLCEKYHISISHLSAMIKRETGHTFTEHVTNLRIEKAKELLAWEALSVSEVIELVGYNDYFYFLKLFKKCVGVTPSKYRKNLEN